MSDGFIWQPQPGPQLAAFLSPCDMTLFGGSRGGGKSDVLLGRQIDGGKKYASHWNGIVIRRKYKDFAEMRLRIDQLIEAGLPAERVGGDMQTNIVKFDDGGRFTLFAALRLEMISDLVGQQFTEISVDEGPTLPFFTQAVDKLRGSLRSPYGVPCHMFFTGNPGGPGHQQVKDMFVTPAEPNTVFVDDEGETRIFIPSFLEDNRILCENDPEYVRRLRSIQDPALRKAWLEGDWDVFIGQAFAFQAQWHVLANPPEVPEYVQVYSTFDWGYGAPFSWAWWWVDADGRLYRFNEWYGWTGVPNQGLRLTDSQIAEGIREREDAMGLGGRKIIRLAGHDCFARKPDYKGGGQGESTAEIFARYGLYLQVADSTRDMKIRQFRERLRVRLPQGGDPPQMPMLVVYPTCKAFIRTIPSLSVDDSNPEEVDTDQEDHVFDEAAQICMQRKLVLPEDKEQAYVKSTFKAKKGALFG